ncbi:MAG: protein kinase domain-containing protein [Planctomycetota bacterium]|jgi:serine/threonine protein kinase
MGKRSIFGLEPDQLNELLSAASGDFDELDSDKAKSSSPHQEKPSDKPKVAKATAFSQDTLEQHGSQIGRYKLLSVLGEGGMGIVYLAEQQEPIRRKVALKVIKPGMDSSRVIARFEAERQALALLDHPNIAHVHDAGTTDAGRPYFVMEYVKGLPITEYCDKHKLTIEERLRLFQQLCDAVQHAHQKGIIHRDIKPSNILVYADREKAIPKIIDFGVAKAIAQPLTERTVATEDSQLLGTPEYMSPEQADMSNEDIDTRSDIYSLGVLLYVLLTGVLPFDSTTFRKGGIEQIRHIIREEEPKTPSNRLTNLGEEAIRIAKYRCTEVKTLAHCLHKELEWIPLKAMRKERARRYRSASELADDIENYLEGAPLIAGPESTLYRAVKFLHRHKHFVAAVLVIVASLLFAVVVSATMWRWSEQSRQKEIATRVEAQAVSDFLRNNVLASLDPYKVGGRTITIRSVLDIASENVKGKFKDTPLSEAEIRHTLGHAYWSLGLYQQSEQHLSIALDIQRSQLGADHTDTLATMQLVCTICKGSS